jgi:adenosylcobinamide-GDP ribazoletransferase
MAGAALAVSLLTIVPVRARHDPRGLGPAAIWFPLVGAAVGAAGGAVRVLADRPLGPTVAAVLATATLIVATGALHQDALADCADGLGVRGDRTRRLEVMRDSAIGAFGTLALILWAALTIAVLAALPRADALADMALAAGLGRWAAVAHAALVRPARADGLGAAFTPGMPATALATAIALAGAATHGTPGLAAAATAALVAAAISAWAKRTLGGRTGDTLGATVALAELAALTMFLGLT